MSRRWAALWAAFVFLGLVLPAPARAQGAVQWLGSAVGGHLMMTPPGGRAGQGMDAGGPTVANGTPANNQNPGTLPSGVAFVGSGQALAFYSGYATAAYNQLLLGFDGNGNALITVNNVGGGPQPGCSFSVNGTLYPCGSSGGGNVIGGPSSITGDLALFNGTTGKVLRGGAPGQFTDTLTSAPASDYGTLQVLSQPGLDAATLLAQAAGAGPIWDGFRSVISVPSGTAQATISSLAGYVVNHNAAVGGLRNPVGLFGLCETDTSGASCFGINTLVTDFTSHVIGSLTGVVLQNELDFNITSAGTVATGLAIAGGSLVQPASLAGFAAFKFGGPAIYNSGVLFAADGVANTGVFLGGAPGAPAISAISQKIVQQSYTTGLAALQGSIFLDAIGSYVMAAPTGGSVLLEIGTDAVIAALTATPAANATGLGIYVNNNGGIGLVQVTLGSPNSCGTARCLEVAN